MEIRLKFSLVLLIVLGTYCNLKAQTNDSILTINLKEQSQRKGGSVSKGLDKYLLVLVGLSSPNDTLYSISSDNTGIQVVIDTNHINPILGKDSIKFDITQLISTGSDTFPLKITNLGEENPPYFGKDKSVLYTIGLKNAPTPNTEEDTACFFYSKEMLRVTSQSLRPSIKPFYVIRYNFGELNQGPEILRYPKTKDQTENDATVVSDDKKPKIKQNVWVGRNAYFSFYGLGTGFDNSTHSISFYNYHQEDAETFKGIISTGLGKTTSTASDEDLSGDKNQSNKIGTKEKLQLLSNQLDVFLKDIEKSSVSSTTFTEALTFVKQNIKSCFGVGIDNHEIFLKNFDSKEEKGLANDILFRIFLLESKVEKKHPPFKIEDSDALISKIDYTNNGVSTYVNYPAHEIPILGGFKVDFSTGIIGSSLVDKAFTIIDADSRIDTIAVSDNEIRIDTTSMKQIIREKSDKYQIGFGVFAHFYPRLTPYLNLSITTGFIVKDNLAFQFPVGFSLLAGRQSRLVFSGGVTFGQSKTLSAKYTEGKPIEATDLLNVNDSQLTVLKSDKGYFFGLTYNFAKIRPK